MVMIVDDEPTIRRLVASALISSGYDVLDADSPAAALRMLDACAQLDLLVTDIVMPELGGPELAEKMRTLRPGLKVLFISGYAPEGIETDIGQGTDFLQKPFRLPELVRRVGRMLRP